MDGGFRVRFQRAMDDGLWYSAEGLAAELGRKSIKSGVCFQALRDMVRDGLVDVRGAGDGREWRLAKK